MGVTEKLAKFCADLSYGDIPGDAVECARQLTFDTIGVAAGGSTSDSSRIMKNFMKTLDRSGNGTIIAGNTKAAPEYAALLNGAFAHSLDYDDLSNIGSLHPGAAVIPAALAACEMTAGGGREFFLGTVVGYEVMCRLGKALGPIKHYGRGFHPTGTCGAFGAAAAAGKILGLTPEQMTNALGIAGSQTAGSMEFLAQGAWTKRMHPGWAAHSGIIAAMLAREGYTGPSTILEGKSGFLNAYSYDTNPEEIVEDLGGVLYIAKISVKPYAACRYKHGPIDGIRKIVAENSLKADDVSEVTIGMLQAGYSIVVEPPEAKFNPQNIVDAQFSMPYGAAVAILFGNALPDQYTMDIIKSPKVAELMKKVNVRKDPELDRLYPAKWPATVEIRTRGGEVYKTYVEYPKGDPANPLSWDELMVKFNSVTGQVYGPERQGEIVGEIRKLDEKTPLDALQKLIGARDVV